MIVHNKLIRVLVIDDELLQRKFVTRQLAELKFSFDSAESFSEGLKKLEQKDFDVVLLDVQMADVSGLEALPQIRDLEDAPEVIMLTLDKSLESGLQAMRGGAYDYLTKPAAPEAIEIIVKRAAEKRRLVRQNLTLRDFIDVNADRKSGNTAFLPPENAEMQKVFEQAERVAQLDSTILITGESGTGKDVLARHVHQKSDRRKSAMVAVNCGAMPEPLFESEFFGYEKGAFSGAAQTKHGLIEVADGSTLFLDEIGELPLALQVKLLRFLESGEFRRVGGTRDLYSNARLIAATNSDLGLAVKESRFREDLFYRLNVIELHLPPLRDRPEDFHGLTMEFLNLFRQKFQKPALDFTPAARQKLARHDYPGNVRELRNTIERAAALVQGDLIDEAQIIFPDNQTERKFDPTAAESVSAAPPVPEFPTPGDAIIPLEDLERNYIKRILEHTDGNREQAARLLGISERTLYRRINDFRL